MPSSHLILGLPLLLLPRIPPSIRIFSSESTLRMRWPKYWSFSFSINSFQRNPRADLLQNGLLGSPCCPRDSQEYSSNTTVQKHQFFGTQPSSQSNSHIHRWTLVGKVMSLLWNMLSMLVVTFLPRSKRLLISWLQSPSALILEPPPKSLTLFPLFPHLFPMK